TAFLVLWTSGRGRKPAARVLAVAAGAFGGLLLAVVLVGIRGGVATVSASGQPSPIAATGPSTADVIGGELPDPQPEPEPAVADTTADDDLPVETVSAPRPPAPTPVEPAPRPAPRPTTRTAPAPAPAPAPIRLSPEPEP